MSKFSINLLVYNGLEFLPQCVESVFSQSYNDYDFLIIDNSSNDGSRDYVKNIGKLNPRVKIVLNKDNIGFAAGHNQGIRISDSDYIVCLNQDVVLDRNFLKNAVEILSRDDKIGALQPKLLRLGKINEKWQKTDIIDTAGLAMFKNRRIINRGQGQSSSKFQFLSSDIFGVDGASPIYKRAMLEDIKIPIKEDMCEYFDESFFMYKEDVDLAWRMKLFGWRSVYVPNVIGWHARGAGDSAKTNYFDVIKERRKISRFSKYYSFKNQRLMQIKNELWPMVLFHLPRLIFKEIASWFYILIFEHYTIKAIIDLFKQTPEMFKKRRFIMNNKKVNVKEMKKWFL